MKLMYLQSIIKNYLFALPADQYLVRLIHLDKAQYPALKRIIDAEAMLRSLPYYKAKNKEGYNIYARPIGYEYVLLDDLRPEKLKELAKIKPSLLMETSPQNYQAFVRLSFIPSSREEALMICKQLAELFDADLASAEPDHVGRLPGFTNRKPKHKQTNGLYPFVRLHKFADRISTFSRLCAPCAQKKIPKEPVGIQKTQVRLTKSQSEADFNLACMLIRQGKKDEYIYAKIKAQYNAHKHKESDYIPRTIRNARKAVKGF